MSDQIQFTETAIDKVNEMYEANVLEDDIEAIRVLVAGGGCSGFQYGFQPEKQTSEDDTVFDYGRVKFVVDPLSMMYLEGATVDYKQGIMSSEFVIRNPNATSQCGCGNSFSA